MNTRATFLILAVCALAWTGCEKKKTTRTVKKPVDATAKGSAADFASDAEMLAAFENEEGAITNAISQGSPTVAQYARRGDLRVFLGKFDDAVTDYEKMVELDPTQDAKHWRLGIAYYLSGDFHKAAKQFEKFHEADNTDRETGLWHFLAVSGIESVKDAQAKMLKYTTNDRDPFPKIYELYNGIVTVEEFFRDLYDDGSSTKPEVMFYAQLYGGIYEDVNGRQESAAKFFRMAHENSWGRKATGGPGYMWQLARLLATDAAAQPKAEKKPEGGSMSQ